jgi:tetratricopeptide (TPR) repeat protein
LEIDPKHVHSWKNKGWTLGGLGKYNEAIEYFDKALEIDPKDVRTFNARDAVFKVMEKQPVHHNTSEEPRGKKSRWKRIFR